MSNTSRFGITIQVLPSENLLEYFIGEYFNSLLITIVVVVFFFYFYFVYNLKMYFYHCNFLCLSGRNKF